METRRLIIMPKSISPVRLITEALTVTGNAILTSRKRIPTPEVCRFSPAEATCDFILCLVSRKRTVRYSVLIAVPTVTPRIANAHTTGSGFPPLNATRANRRPRTSFPIASSSCETAVGIMH